MYFIECVENSYASFNSRDEIYLVFTKKSKFYFMLLVGYMQSLTH